MTDPSTAPAAEPTVDVRQLRRDVIRDICRTEGHGELIELMRFADAYPRYVCQRGCGIDIYEVREATPVDEVRRMLGADSFAAVHFRGTLEVPR